MQGCFPRRLILHLSDIGQAFDLCRYHVTTGIGVAEENRLQGAQQDPEKRLCEIK